MQILDSTRKFILSCLVFTKPHQS